MREVIIRIGRIGSVVAITLLSIALSVSITVSSLLAVGEPVTVTLIGIAILAPALIAPSMTWYVMGLLFRIHRLELEQRQLATYDPLTGVMARRSFFESCETLIHQCRRHDKALALAIIDLDDFKQINDSLGHGAGDAVLKAFAQRVSAILRQSDLIGRVGGEEFAVAMYETRIEESQIALEKIRRAVEEGQVLYAGAVIRYTISIGVADYNPGCCEEIDALMRRADNALYAAKRAGKNRIVLGCGEGAEGGGAALCDCGEQGE